MSHQTDRGVKKLWNYCQLLRDDGLSYQDYLKQLTFLVFIKMADERVTLTGEEQSIPQESRCPDLPKQLPNIESDLHEALAA